MRRIQTHVPYHHKSSAYEDAAVIIRADGGHQIWSLEILISPRRVTSLGVRDFEGEDITTSRLVGDD